MAINISAGRLVPCAFCGARVCEPEAECCWHCGGPLCGACWEDMGHCGHPDAYRADRELVRQIMEKQQ